MAALLWSSLTNSAPTYAARVNVHINQVGYVAGWPKRAVIANSATAPLSWQLKNSSGATVMTGNTSVLGYDAASGDTVHGADFSAYTTPGTNYTLTVGGVASNPFDIGGSIYARLKYDALAYFYHNRSGIAITMPYAGRTDLTRPAGHLGIAPNQGDTSVPCAPGIGCSYRLDVRGGWYDAGDHGKYVVNGGISVWTMLNQYERAQHFGSTAPFADGRMNIPEQANGVPDILDEARWQMEFMLRMQVPASTGSSTAGMVHHKMHDASWTGIPTRPDQDSQPRVLRPVSTAATLNLAATAAQCARIWRSIDAAFANKCQAAAETAWSAARANPAMYASDGDGTGGGPYGDSDVSDEFYWAAAELYITTGNAAYRSFLTGSPHYRSAAVPGWQATQALGTISLAVVPNNFSAADIAGFRSSIAGQANSILATINGQAYRVPIATYDWGSNSSVTNAMILLGLANDFSADPRYLHGMIDGMDYLLGRNALDQSYVTGYGENAVQNPHHRFWAFQANNAYPRPPAGALSGGPNTGIQDPLAASALAGCKPQRCWMDHIDSWSTNEITINWNAPLAWVAAFVDEKAGGAPPPPTATPATPTATPTTPPIGTRLLDGFESGSLSAWSVFKDAASSVTPLIVSPGQIGQNAMRVNASIASYGGVQQLFPASQSWSPYLGIRFGFNGANSGATFRLEVLDNSPNAGNAPDAAERWVYSFTDNVAGWRTISVPWSAFGRRGDWQPAGAPNDGFGRGQVWGFNVTAPSGNSSFQLDQIELYGESVITPTPTPSATPLACGSANVAINRPATSSSNESAALTPNLAVDGNAGTRWSSAFSDPQWIAIDLGASVAVCRVRLNWEAAYGGAYQIQGSADGASWITIKTVSGADGGIDDHSGLSATARYLRIYGTQRATPYGYSLFEVEVYRR